MQFYLTYVTFHIVFAGMWIIFFAADIILKKRTRSLEDSDTKKELISLYLKFSNLFGIVGSTGIALTGIIMVLLNPGYGFFDMSHAHWLATKQILFVIILLITFIKIIPESKKLRIRLSEQIDVTVKNQFEKVVKLNLIVSILVILNFIFAVTHRFYS